jgi:hypothetical protein
MLFKENYPVWTAVKRNKVVLRIISLAAQWTKPCRPGLDRFVPGSGPKLLVDAVARAVCIGWATSNLSAKRVAVQISRQ